MGGQEMRMCTSFAPSSRSLCTRVIMVVPRTMESSTMQMRRFLIMERTGFSFTRTPKLRMLWLGWMKVRPT